MLQQNLLKAFAGKVDRKVKEKRQMGTSQIQTCFSISKTALIMYTATHCAMVPS